MPRVGEWHKSTCALAAGSKALHARLEDGDDRIFNLVPLVENNHVGNPPDISDLLLSKLHPRVEHTKVILLFEGKLILESIVLVDDILNGLLQSPLPSGSLR